jgi:hypothetical protein
MTFGFVFVLRPVVFSCLSRRAGGMQSPALHLQASSMPESGTATPDEKNLPRKQDTPLFGPSRASGICRRGGSFTDSGGMRCFPLGGSNGTMSGQAGQNGTKDTAVPFSAASRPQQAPRHSMNLGRARGQIWHLPGRVRLRPVSSQQPLLANIFSPGSPSQFPPETFSSQHPFFSPTHTFTT